MKILIAVLALAFLVGGGGTCPAFAEDGNNVLEEIVKSE